MNYSKDEVIQYCMEEDVKFIRLAFCDVFGKQKNISIMPGELERAFGYGIAIDASAIEGFGDEAHSDLLLHPEPETLCTLPWRPEHGRVVRMMCCITYPDGRPFECDSRTVLKNAVEYAKSRGFEFNFGSEQEFYLFELDDKGSRTMTPYDNAGYMDIAPEDRGENIRREICLTLEQMGIYPESSHHEEGPGQNEIDFRYSDALSAADNAQTFKTVVRTVARRNGLYADFSPKPIKNAPGNGFHINVSLRPDNDADVGYMTAGILEHINEMTVFLNPAAESYFRLGNMKAPGYVSWSHANRSGLIRIPASDGEYRRIELRSPDPAANPYLAYALIIYAGLDGIDKKAVLPGPSGLNMFSATEEELADYRKLPRDIHEARAAAVSGSLAKERIPGAIFDLYCASGKHRL